ncbi:hypothetical protein SAMN05443634_104108 [Chishuiella changwenlii]|uniref:Uncharacterized protein n=1 Tax=Chishuiella changwenlii TaxID=1434701 RepID=A0A1M6W0N6_9FLAO|nr:hypothetical protein [Chishuiella changwenlii]GGE89427.1 hypothetical protein GCM10010984_03830 [Chishuiella changwenlii]SHK87115.1 hypothetical protein SAMN05443634_104108 [Chishuiella changwenlii]
MAKNKKTVTAEIVEKAGGEKNLRRLILKDEQEQELEVIARVPDRTTIGEYLKYANVNPNKAQEILVNGCLLTDKDLVKANDTLFLSAVSGIAEIIPIAVAKVEKY